MATYPRNPQNPRKAPEIEKLPPQMPPKIFELAKSPKIFKIHPKICDFFFNFFKFSNIKSIFHFRRLFSFLYLSSHVSKYHLILRYVPENLFLIRSTPEYPLSPMENSPENPLIFMENAPENPRNYVVNFRWPPCIAQRKMNLKYMLSL